MGTLNGITYSELDGSNALQFSRDGITGRRLFLVDWGDRIAFCEALLGYTNAIGHVPIRVDAQIFPDYDYLLCQDAQVEGIGQLDEVMGATTYNLAKVTAEYRPWQLGSSNLEGDDELDEDLEAVLARYEQSVEWGCEVINMAGTSLYWSAGHPRFGEAIDVPMCRYVPTANIVLTSDSEPEVRWAAIRACMGKISSGIWFGFATGAVRFDGASARRVMTSQGVGAWEVTYRFACRERSWNMMLVGPNWYNVEDVWGTPAPYASVSFNQLFL